jgi:glutaminyl-peptide cyclotransferase
MKNKEAMPKKQASQKQYHKSSSSSSESDDVTVNSRSISSRSSSNTSTTLLCCSPVRIAFALGGILCVSIFAIMIGSRFSSSFARYFATTRTTTTASASSLLDLPSIDSPPAGRFIHTILPSPSIGSTPTPSASPSSLLKNGIYTKSTLVPTSYRIIATYPHDGDAFTQGLVWRGRVLYEGTGSHGPLGSVLRRVDMSGGTYKVLTEKRVPNNHFGEGVVIWPPTSEDTSVGGTGEDTTGSTVLQLTWQDRKMHLWDSNSLNFIGSMPFTSLRNEGWGLTSNGNTLIESDGSEYLHFWDPVSIPRAGSPVPREELLSTRRVQVVERIKETVTSITTLDQNSITLSKFGYGRTIQKLNELEFIHGWVLANIWYDPRVAIIDPLSGSAVSFIDFSALLNENQGHGEDCLNGLAYTLRLDNAESSDTNKRANKPWGGRLWVTGKQWRKIYEIELVGLVEVTDLVSESHLGLKKRRQ